MRYFDILTKGQTLLQLTQSLSDANYARITGWNKYSDKKDDNIANIPYI